MFCLFCLWRAQTAVSLHTDGCACPAVTFQVFSSHSALGFALLGYFFPFRIDSDATQRIKPCLLTAPGSHRSHSTPASVTFLWILINEVCNKLTIEQQQQHLLMWKCCSRALLRSVSVVPSGPLSPCTLFWVFCQKLPCAVVPTAGSAGGVKQQRCTGDTGGVFQVSGDAFESIPLILLLFSFEFTLTSSVWRVWFCSILSRCF